MRHQDEVDLVNRANAISERLKLASILNIHTTHEEFSERLHEVRELYGAFRCAIAEIGPEKLGVTISSRPGDSGEYEKRSFLSTVPLTALVDTGVYRSGHQQLVRLALPVLVAAVYDILATEAILLGEQSHRSEVYVPKRAMIYFVARFRLRRKVSQIVKASMSART